MSRVDLAIRQYLTLKKPDPDPTRLYPTGCVYLRVAGTRAHEADLKTALYCYQARLNGATWCEIPGTASTGVYVGYERGDGTVHARSSLLARCLKGAGFRVDRVIRS